MTGQTRAQPEQLVVKERKAGVSEYTGRAGREAIGERGPGKCQHVICILKLNLVTLTVTNQYSLERAYTLH